MGSRDASEEHRASTPLELLYDLCFVVAIARAATLLHHAGSHGVVTDIPTGQPYPRYSGRNAEARAITDPTDRSMPSVAAGG